MADGNRSDDFDAFLASLNTDTAKKPDDIDLDGLLAELNADIHSERSTEGVPDDAFFPPTDFEDTPPSPKQAPMRKRRQAADVPPVRTNVPPQERQSFFVRHHRTINLVLLLLSVALAVGIMAVILSMSNADPYGGKMMDNIRIAGVNVGGMTKQEAANAVGTAIGSSYYENNMTVVLGKDELILPASQVSPTLDISAAVEAAYACGRTGSTTQRQADYQQAKQAPIDIEIGSCLKLNEDYIRNTISSFIGSFSGTYTPSGYTLEGIRPGLDADSFNASAPCQNLVLTIGTPGGQYNMDGILSTISNAYGEMNFHVVIPSDYLPTLPEALDIDAIYNEVHVDPVEAIPGSGSGEGTPGSCGYTFQLEDARKQLQDANYGDIITIPMEYIMPEKLDSNGTFRAALGSYATPVSSNEAYNQNLESLCAKLNGNVLEAGQTFSFDAAVGSRKETDGYLMAPAHGDQCIETEVGGGSDQVATTLYVAAMTSGMAIVEHSAAPHVCPYTTKGTEVTVSDWRDLKFRNPLDCKVLIRAKVADGQVIVRLLSEKEVDYEIKLDVQQLSTTQPGTVNVDKHVSEGFKAQQVLVEGSEGGQFWLNWVKYKKGTAQEMGKVSEYVTLPALNKAVVILYG